MEEKSIIQTEKITKKTLLYNTINFFNDYFD